MSKTKNKNKKQEDKDKKELAKSGVTVYDGAPIVYIEPNDLKDPKHENIPFNLEDLCLALDLQVLIPKRSEPGLATISSYKSNSGKTLSFLQGTDGMLTTSFTDISGRGWSEGNPETLGIKSVEITLNSTFFPTVTIVFCDVKGSSLMGAMEDEYDSKGTLSQGSFFRTFFYFPYPKFILKVKGYYGKATSYELAVTDFHAKFQADSGDFEIKVDFIGYMFGAYTEIPFKYMLIAPYLLSKRPSLDNNDKQWDYRFPEEYNGVKNPNNAGDKIPTLLELRNTICGVIAKGSKVLQSNPDVKEYKEKAALINGYKTIIDSFKDFIKDLRETNKGRVYEGAHCIFVVGTKDSCVYNISKYHNLVTNMMLFNEKYGDKSGAIAEFRDYSWYGKNDGKFLDDTEGWKCTDVVYEKGTGLNPVWTFHIQSKNGTYIIPETLANDLTLYSDFTPTQGAIGAKIANDYAKSNEVYGFFFQTHNKDGISLKDWCAKQTESLQDDNKLLNDKVKKSTNQTAEKELGFKPTVNNILYILFAHLDCFMSRFYTVIDEIIQNKDRKYEEFGISVNDTDAKRLKENMPPFPNFINSDGKSCYPEEVGNSNTENMAELKLIESMISVAEGTLNASRNANTIGSYFPTLLSDIINTSNPYAKLNEDTSDLATDICATFISRFFNCFGYQTEINGEDISKGSYAGYNLTSAMASFAYTEAYNAYLTISTNTDVKKKITGTTYEFESLQLIGKNDKLYIPGYTNDSVLAQNNNNYDYQWTKCRGVNMVYYPNVQGIKGLIQKDDEKDKYNGEKEVYIIKDSLLEELSDVPTTIDMKYASNVQSQNALYALNREEIFGSSKDAIIAPYDAYISNVTDVETIEKAISTNDTLYTRMYSAIVNGQEKELTLDGIVKSKLDKSGDSIINSKLVRIMFNENQKDKQLATTDIYISQDNLYAKGLLYLESLSLQLDNILGKNFIPGKGVDKVSRLGLLLLGGLCYFNEKRDNNGFTIPTAAKKAECNVYVFGGHGGVLNANDKQNYDVTSKTALHYASGEGKLWFTTLKHPAKLMLKGLFEKWIYTEFSSIDENIAVVNLDIETTKKTIDKLKDFLKTSNNGTTLQPIGDYVDAVTQGEGASSSITYYNKYSLDYTTAHTSACTMLSQTEYEELNNALIKNDKKIVLSILMPDVNKHILQSVKLDGDNDLTFTYEDVMPSLGSETTTNTILCCGSPYRTLESGNFVDEKQNIISSAITKTAYDKFKQKLEDFIKENQLTKQLTQQDNSGYYMPVSNNDLKLSTYLKLKSMYDKALAGFDSDFWNIDGTTSNGNLSEFERFTVTDVYWNRNVGNELCINISTLNDILDKISGPKSNESYNPSFYEVLDELAQGCHSLLLGNPALKTFSRGDAQSYIDIFRPESFNEMTQSDYNGSGYLWVYTHEPSQHLDVEESEYDDDGFDIADSYGNISPTFPSKIFADSNTVPAFGVTFGKQNQSIFKSININMDTREATEYSIKNSIQIADNFGKDARIATFASQNLFHVYSNYSYDVTIEMMGDTCIAPMMYFQLNNIPMFRGAYYVTSVKHSISDGGMTTTISGTRINKIATPIVEEIMMISDINDVQIDTDPTSVGTTKLCDLYKKTYGTINVDTNQTIKYIQDQYSSDNHIIKSVADVELMRIGEGVNWNVGAEGTTLTTEQKSAIITIAQMTRKIGYEIIMTKIVNNTSDSDVTLNAISPFGQSFGEDVSYALFDLISLATIQGTNIITQVVLLNNIKNGLYNVQIRLNKEASKESGVPSYIYGEYIDENSLKVYAPDKSFEGVAYEHSKALCYTLSALLNYNRDKVHKNVVNLLDSIWKNQSGDRVGTFINNYYAQVNRT